MKNKTCKFQIWNTKLNPQTHIKVKLFEVSISGFERQIIGTEYQESQENGTRLDGWSAQNSKLQDKVDSAFTLKQALKYRITWCSKWLSIPILSCKWLCLLRLTKDIFVFSFSFKENFYFSICLHITMIRSAQQDLIWSFQNHGCLFSLLIQDPYSRPVS